MKLFWNQILGLPIVAKTAERPVGFLTGVYFDPENGKILAYRSGFSMFISPIDVLRFFPDHIEITEEDALVPAEELLRLRECGLKKANLLGKKVLDEAGHSLGKAHNFCIDPGLSELQSIESSTRFLFWDWNRRLFEAKRIQSITEKVIVVNADARMKQKSPAKVAGLSKLQSGVY